LAGILGRLRTIEQPLAFAIKIAQLVSLHSIGQNAKKEMAGQMRGRASAKYCVPTASKLSDIEIAQSHDLDVKYFSVRQSRTDFDLRHGGQLGRRFG
jgi:hypothetical protein